MTDVRRNPEPNPISSPVAAFLGWLAILIENALFIAIWVPRPPSGLTVRALHHLYDAGHLLALAALSSMAVFAWAHSRPKLLRRTWIDAIALSLVAIALGSLVLLVDLDNLAGRITLRFGRGNLFATVVLNVLVMLTALGITLAWATGRLLARPKLRWLGVAGGIVAAVTNQLLLKNDYEGAHFYLAWAAATVIAASLRGAVFPWPLTGSLKWSVFAVSALLGCLAVATRPTTNVLLQLYTTPGSVLAPLIAHARGRAIPEWLMSEIPPEQAAWFEDRTKLPDVPPTAPLVASPVVILLGIDSLRADVIANPKYLATLPEISRLKTNGVYFSEARSPGPGTVFTFSALFSSLYFSEMYWSPKAGGIWPWQDESARFPGVLQSHGVSTVDLASIVWFQNEWGVARGFQQETNLDPRPRAAMAKGSVLIDAMIERLRTQGPGPAFYFTHFMDAHAPYDQGRLDGTPKDRFVSEVALVDAQIGRLDAAIAKMAIADRVVIVLTADHGEAFGEHHSTLHGTTLYEELLRVPLLVSGAGLKPRDVTEPVSLIDIGPTVLDLFGVPTPARSMGQSLVPFLRGESPKLTRPILAEGRLKRALIFRDGYKVITDERRGTVELYNLKRDPGELQNLADEGAAEVEPRVGAIDSFFRAHTLKRPGYVPPYRP